MNENSKNLDETKHLSHRRLFCNNKYSSLFLDHDRLAITTSGVSDFNFRHFCISTNYGSELSECKCKLSRNGYGNMTRKLYQMTNLQSSRNRLAVIAVFIVLLLLTTATGVNCQQEDHKSSKPGLETEIPLSNISEKFPNQSLSSSTSSSLLSTTAATILITSTEESIEREKVEEPSSFKADIILTNKASDPNTSSRMRAFPNSSIRGVSMSMNRNALINGDNILQRQLREKAKQDSLESIKMHILMRLNLKKLPNITKPISVPQNIIEDFYKGYNASLSSTGRRRSSEASMPAGIPNSNKNLQSEGAASDDSVSSESENLSSQMQGDDANANSLNHFNMDTDDVDGFNFGVENDDEKNESILSHVSSIYLFPEQPQSHMRHRKTDVLRFKFDSSYTDVSHATLHVYLRGWDWISTHQPELIDEITNQQNKDIVVAIHRVMRRTNGTSFTHKAKMFEFRQPIPSGQGQWVNVDLKPLFGLTLTGVLGRGSNGTQEILIKGVESWMKQLVVTTDNTSKNPLTVHIEIGSKKKHRRKRSLMDCTESDHDEVRCCRYPLRVNFTSFGWNFVVAPTSFDAYFCSGDCRVGYLEQYPHTHLAALTTSASPCCSPTKMSPLTLLYFDDNHNLVLSVIPNMSVDECSCS